MQTSETIGKISEALSKAQGSFKNASFDSINPHYKSRYASLASIVSTAREAMSSNNLAVTQAASIADDRLSVTTLISHSSGEWIRDSISVKIDNDSIQMIGSKISYLKRYALSAMLTIVADDDDDDGELAMQRNNTQKPAKPSQVTNLDEHKKTRVSGNPKSESADKAEKTPQKPDNKGEQAQKRVQKIRLLFNLSAKLGQTPDDMKAVIGNLIGLDRPIKESAEIKDSDLDTVISAFSKELELKEAA
ncbi:MAG TPA: ERF family protein [Candidatus Rifleibacterium sp.]|nr:ERF family protein [Candidatus Rifleibacterium sp.]HPT48029.1 ERF family protein [Candidatus Rifleibacterium sp.]